MPFRLSSDLKRFQFPFLMESHQRTLRMERGSIEAVLPPAQLADSGALNMLLVALSFQTWRLLRHDQGLQIDEAQAVVLRLVDALLVQIAAPQHN
jgi:hypothetical protein